MGASSCALRDRIEELAPMGRSYGGGWRFFQAARSFS